MRNLNLFFVVCILFACKNNEANLPQATSGFSYAIIPQVNVGDTILAGDVVKVHIRQFIDDSLLNSTYGAMPMYMKIDKNLRQFDYSEIVPLLHVNDSAVCYFNTSEIISKAGANADVPDFLRKGKQVIVQVKVMQKFSNDSAAQNDVAINKQLVEAAGFKMAVHRMDSIIQTLPKDVLKLPNGVVIQFVEKGAGAKLQSGMEIALSYRGYTDKGKIFETVNKQNPYRFHLGEHETIDGFEMGIAQLHVDDSAHIYVPCGLAYGANGAGKDIVAFANLIFKTRVIAAK
jgi:FKBP-type peptidyl-prolyl cis-trans isomerase FkpA